MENGWIFGVTLSVMKDVPVVTGVESSVSCSEFYDCEAQFLHF
jgi:hypothetical protein